MLESTNEEAKRIARLGALHGEAVVADRQTRGKGRRGRSWQGLGGENLFLSVILRPELPPTQAPRLVAVAAVAVAEALEDFGASSRIKWPNDVEVGGRKIAGILLELSAQAERIDFAVVGVGLNLEGDLEALGEEIAARATTLERELGMNPGRDALMFRILDHLRTWSDRLEAEGFAPVRERYLELSSTVGARVRMMEAEQVLEGEAIDVDEEGALWVRLDGGEDVRFVSGDLVTLRKVG